MDRLLAFEQSNSSMSDSEKCELSLAELKDMGGGLGHPKRSSRETEKDIKVQTQSHSGGLGCNAGGFGPAVHKKEIYKLEKVADDEETCDS